MKLSDFGYNLPKNQIAQYPLDERDSARLMVIHRDPGAIEHVVFKDITEYFYPGDILVLNDTRVIPARLYGRKPSGRRLDSSRGKVEVLLIKEIYPNNWEATLKGLRDGQVLFKHGISGYVSRNNGTSTVEFTDKTIMPSTIGTKKYENSRGVSPRQSGKMPDLFSNDIKKILSKIGVMPLPPYIKRPATELDSRYYQTVYAEKDGAIAAPTAGLHFTTELLEIIKEKCVEVVKLTLHVGQGTFKPITCQEIERHQMEEEYYEIPENTANIINRAKSDGRRVIAVGTTVTRALEASVCEINGKWQIGNGKNKSKIKSGHGNASIFIYPGYSFKVIDALITNFHLPKSTPLMLTSAFSGIQLLRKAYLEALNECYRFFSYGDAMLII